MGSFLSSRRKSNWKSDARYAMECGMFCVVCGSPFDVQGDIYIDPKEPQFQWLFDFRLLGSISDVFSNMVACEDSTPINLSGIPGIFLSERVQFSNTGAQYFQLPGHSGQRDIWFETLPHAANSGTLFPLHEACITTSCKAIDCHQSKMGKQHQEPALAVLNQLLSTRFIARHTRADISEDIRNDVFNLCSYSNTHGPHSVLAMTRLDWWGGDYARFYTNPIEELDATCFVYGVLQALPHSTNERNCTLTTTREPKGLERLPPELLDAVCSYLPARSVIALCRTSKALAMKIALDNAFWRKGLRDGSLHPHIWDLDTKWIEKRLQTSHPAPSDPTLSWDWRGAAGLLATKKFPSSGRDSRLIDIPNGLWNRCRIWSIIEDALVTKTSDSSVNGRSNGSL